MVRDIGSVKSAESRMKRNNISQDERNRLCELPNPACAQVSASSERQAEGLPSRSGLLPFEDYIFTISSFFILLGNQKFMAARSSLLSPRTSIADDIDVDMSSLQIPRHAHFSRWIRAIVW